jgi:hypothetical protein
MKTKNFEADFHAWLGRVCGDEKPPSSLVAFSIGLLETPDGYSAYLVGADHYDEDDSDWACDETFTPEERYFELPPGEFKGKQWKAILEAVTDATKGFLATPLGKTSFLARAEAVTVGFDDGDLVRVM